MFWYSGIVLDQIALPASPSSCPPTLLPPQMDPTRSEVFRGLGGAYQSQGQHQMAFASYQQAINLAPSDLLAYLKLGMLYEDLVRIQGKR